MGKLVDSAAVWLICLAFEAMTGLEAYSVAGVLVSATATCLASVVRTAPVRVAVLAAFLAACVASPAVGAFLPVGACLCMFERPVVAKCAWAVAWVAMLPTFATGGTGPLHAGALLCVCVAASLLAWKTTRGERVRHALFDSWDAESARSFALLHQDREMTQEQRRGRTGEGSAAGANPLEGLTERERQIATLVAEGKDNHAIAEELFLSEGTVRNYISAILSKKQLKNRTQLAVLCLGR